MRQLSSGARAALIATAGVCWLLFYGGWLLATPGCADALRIFADTAYLVPLATATGFSLYAWRRAPAELTSFWGLMSAGTGAWLASDTAWCVRDLVTGSVPYPWWSDGGYVLSYALFLCAIYAAFRPRFQTVGAARLLEGAAVVCCLGVVWWFVLLRPIGLDLDPTALTTLAYGASGLLMIGMLVSVRMLPARQGTLAMRLVALGITCSVVTDALYVRAAETEGYLTGALMELGWEAQGVFLTVAAYVGASGIGRTADWSSFRDRPRLTLSALAAAIGGTTVVLVAAGYREGALSRALVLALVVPSGLVAVRMALELRARRPRTGAGTNGFDERLRHLVARGRHFAEPFALAIVAPDQPGDATVIARFRPRRDVDTVSVLEDGRAAMLIARTTEITALELADDAREEAARLNSTFSVGVATWDPDEPPDNLLAVAHAASHNAQLLGGNQVVTTTEPPDFESLLGLAELVDEREGVPVGHSRTVADVAADVARAMGLDDDEARLVYVAGYLHDVGKITLPTTLFRQHVPLQTRQWEAVRGHPLAGAAILERVPSTRTAAEIVAAHHERVDGTGYPGALRGDAIPLASRIVGVADSLVSMTEDRPYRAALSETHVLTSLWQQAGRRYDGDVVAAVLHLSSTRSLRPATAAPA